MAYPLRSLLFAAVVLAASVEVDAQVRRPSSYAPARPTTSSYLTLFNTRGGPVSAYYGIVRPQQRQAIADQRRVEELQFQRRQINELARREATDELAPTGRAGWFGVGVQRNTFRDTSHYFFRWDERQTPRPR